METTQQTKTAGHVKTIEIHTTAPLKMDQVLDLRALNVFVGQNGTGKTVILITVFAMTNITAAAVARRNNNLSVNDLSYAQWVFDHCFTDNPTDGSIKIIYDCGLETEITFDHGKVTSLQFSGIEEVRYAAPGHFMSAAFRTFTAISGYLKVRRLCGKTNELEIMEVMTKEYKLYDVLHVEKMIKLMPFTPDEKLKSVLSSISEGREEIESFGFDPEKDDFYAIVLDKSLDGPPRKKYLSTYGNGHQAWFNMVIANSQF